MIYKVVFIGFPDRRTCELEMDFRSLPHLMAIAPTQFLTEKYNFDIINFVIVIATKINHE